MRQFNCEALQWLACKSAAISGRKGLRARQGGACAQARSRPTRRDDPQLAVSGAPPLPRGRRAARGSGTRTGSDGAARAALASSSPWTSTRSPEWKHFDYGRWGLGPVLRVWSRFGFLPLCHHCVGRPVACGDFPVLRPCSLRFYIILPLAASSIPFGGYLLSALQ